MGAIFSTGTLIARRLATTLLMFEKPETLWNCVTLATLSILTRSDHDDNGPDSINGTLVADANKTLHFGDLNKFDYPFRHYRGCAFESCSTFGGCPLQIAEFMAIPINTTRIGNLSDIMNGNYCASAHAGIDFDIAGPGVSFSAHNLATNPDLM
ncbi:hypothetical protein CGMCC3_g4720 [Colletotrichum fructicola]|nr:uncharacterized protein CGMCC3_g4720 [Colletotrichum fructicola]KAE9579409.1 hypothetical protein CGMCC3_g4720 [Colletotrichum fructicola]